MTSERTARLRTPPGERLLRESNLGETVAKTPPFGSHTAHDRCAFHPDSDHVPVLTDVVGDAALSAILMLDNQED